MLAIYVLFWTISAFMVLPFGVKTHDELGMAKVPGQADSAPGNFKPLTVLLYTTLLSALLFGLFYLNFNYGWIDRNSFDFLFGDAV
jgi:predicted secreted protein